MNMAVYCNKIVQNYVKLLFEMGINDYEKLTLSQYSHLASIFLAYEKPENKFNFMNNVYTDLIAAKITKFLENDNDDESKDLLHMIKISAIHYYNSEMRSNFNDAIEKLKNGEL